MTEPANDHAAGDALALIAAIRARVGEAETAFRRRYLPPPSRDAPRPAPEVLQRAQALEAIGRSLDAVAGQLRTQPAAKAAMVRDIDGSVAEHAAFLWRLLSGMDLPAVAADEGEIGGSVAFLQALVRRRADAAVNMRPD